MRAQGLIEIYRCLGDISRLRIMNLLARGPLCVCHVQEVLDLGQVAASKHLSYLRRHGLVTAQRHQQWMVYSLTAPHPTELDWQLRCLRECASVSTELKADLVKLKACRSSCGWVDTLLKPTSITRFTRPLTSKVGKKSNE